MQLHIRFIIWGVSLNTGRDYCMMYKYQCVDAEFFSPLNAILFLYCMEIFRDRLFERFPTQVGFKMRRTNPHQWWACGCHRTARTNEIAVGSSTFLVPRAPLGHPFLSRSENINYWKIGQELLSGTTFYRALSKDDFVRNACVIWT